MTTVVNIRAEAYDILIAHPSPWGNPFAIGPDCSREQALARYKVYIRRRPNLLARLPELIGKRLGCYCAPLPCHGNILIELMQERELISL